MTNAMNKRQSSGLTLPQSSDDRNFVVSNILTSLATLDETAQLQWIQETSRQVDNERAYQRRENGVNGNSGKNHHRYDQNGEPDAGLVPLEIAGVGYKERGRDGSYGIATVPAPSPAVPMGRPSKQGFFRRFMGIGPKVPIDSDIMIAAQQPRKLVKTTNSVQPRKPDGLSNGRCGKLKGLKEIHHLCPLKQTSQRNLVLTYSKRSLPNSLDVVQRFLYPRMSTDSSLLATA